MEHKNHPELKQWTPDEMEQVRSEVWSSLDDNVEFLDADESIKTGKVNPFLISQEYKNKGKDLNVLFAGLPTTRHKGQIEKDFVDNKEHSSLARFSEMLPLLANKEGRLGEYFDVKVTKTAKMDDEGNSFVDLVVEMTNNFVKGNENFPNVHPHVALCVDVTTNKDKEGMKEDILRKFNLDTGEMANVLCYQNEYGVLGIDAPKVVVLEDRELLLGVSQDFSKYVVKRGEQFVVTNDKKFDEVYREYFSKFLESIRQNVLKNISELVVTKGDLKTNQKRKALKDSYQAIVDFIDAYKKTPTIKTDVGVKG